MGFFSDPLGTLKNLGGEILHGAETFVKDIWDTFTDPVSYLNWVGAFWNLQRKWLNNPTGAAPSPDQIAGAINGTLVSGAQTAKSIPVIYGVRTLGGQLIFEKLTGDNNEYLHQVFVWGFGEVEKINAIYLDDTVIQPGFSTKYDSSIIHMNHHVGTETQAADADLMAAVSEWTTEHQGKGIAYTYMCLKWDKDIFIGRPRVKAEVWGRIIDDPRIGSSAFSGNPALVLRDYLLSSKYGLGASSADVDDTYISTAADYCETQRTPYPGATAQNLFEIDGIIDTSRQVRDNIMDILRHCAGYLPPSSGTYNLVIDKTETPLNGFTLNEDNIIGGWAIKTGGKRSRFNRVSATFSNSRNEYKADTAIFDSSAYRTEDNGLILEHHLDLSLCTDPYRAQDICELFCRASRLPVMVSLLATVEALQCQVGNVVNVTHSTPGWVDQPMRIFDMSLKDDGNVQMTLEFYADYIYNLSDKAQISPSAGGGLPDPSIVQAPIGLTLSSGTAELIRNAAGIISRIHAQWIASADAYVIGYEVQYKKSADSIWLPAASPVGQDNVSAYIAPVLDGAQYDVRVRAQNALGFHSAWLTQTFYAVIGQSEAPPDVDTFTVLRQTDGTRQFDWTYTNPPIDFQSGGFEIRYKLGTGATWDTMTALHTGLLAASPYETNKLAKGTYTFGIKAVDSTGNYSTNAKIIEATLDDPRLADSVYSTEAASDDWPGTKTNCFIADDGTLEANDSATWSSLPATWAAWTSWNSSPAASFTYVHEVDIGSIITCTPLATASSASDVTLEMSYSTDGVSYSAYEALGPTVTGRYVRIRATVAQKTSEVPILSSLHINITAKTVDEDINDLDPTTLTGSYRIGTGDIRLPISESYIVIKQIMPAFQGISAGDIWTWGIVDKNVSPGPRVQLFKNGALADPPLIDAYVKGV